MHGSTTGFFCFRSVEEAAPEHGGRDGVIVVVPCEYHVACGAQALGAHDVHVDQEFGDLIGDGEGAVDDGCAIALGIGKGGASIRDNRWVVHIVNGKGKGAVEYWAAVVKPGRILFEVGGVPLDVAKEALRLAAQKLPVKTRFVIARDYEA